MTTETSTLSIRLISALLLLAATFAMALAWKWTSFPPDLSALYMAAHFYAEGEYGLIYASPDMFFDATPPVWEPHLAELGIAGEDALPYVYPPIWAAIFAPLTTVLPPTAFFQIVGSVLMAAMVGSVYVAWRLARSFAVPLWAWVMISAGLLATSLISFIAVMHLQIQILVIFLTLLSFERYMSGRSLTAGTLLGFAAMLKLAPAGFVLIFLLDRNWRALGAFIAFCAAVGIAGLAWTGLDLHLAFADSIAKASSGLFVCSVTVSADVILQSTGAILGLTPPIDFAARNVWIPDTGAVLGALNKLLLLVGLVWMLLRTARLPDAQRLLVRLFALSLLINLFGPLGWVHYYLFQLLLLPALLTLLPKHQGAWFIAAFATVTSWPGLLYLRTVFLGDIPPAAVSTMAMLVLFVVVTLGRAAPVRGISGALPA